MGYLGDEEEWGAVESVYQAGRTMRIIEWWTEVMAAWRERFKEYEADLEHLKREAKRHGLVSRCHPSQHSRTKCVCPTFPRSESLINSWASTAEEYSLAS